MAAYEYSCVESTLSRILSPLQSAQLMDKVSLLMATSVDAQSIQYMADRIRFFSFIILDREMSRSAVAIWQTLPCSSDMSHIFTLGSSGVGPDFAPTYM